MRAGRQLVFALAALAGSCDPQANSDYLGEPLISLPGYVKSTGPEPLEAAMLWQRGPPPSTNDQELATRAPVRTGFPATFILHLYQPPPAAARRKLGAREVMYARGNAGAVPYGIAAGAGGALPASTGGAYGIDPSHWVVYLAADVPPGSLTEWWLGAALPAGFHLLRVNAYDPRCVPPEQVDACIADLVHRGAPDDGTSNAGTARSFCLAPYRLSVAPPGEQLVLELGTVGFGSGSGGPCPP